MHPGAFSDQRRGWKTARGPPPPVVHCFCVCSGWEISLCYAGPVNVIFCMSCFILGFSRVFLVPYRLLLRMSFYCIIIVLLSMCSLCWFSCQYLPRLERLLWGRLFESRRLSPQRPGQVEERFCVFFFGLIYLLCHVFPPALNNMFCMPIAMCSECR